MTRPRTPGPSSLLALFVIVACIGRGALAHSVEGLISELGAVTITATSTGNYTAAATWDLGRAPNSTDVVLIPVGKTVTVNNINPIATTVIVRGKLKFSVTANSKLRAETIVVADGGTLTVGDYGTGQAIPGQYTATILIRDVTPMTQDSERLARGIITSHQAVVRMNSGQPRYPYVTFNSSVGPSTSGSIHTTAAVPADWQVGDEVVIPATRFTREWQADMPGSGTTRLRNELRSITAIATSPTGITLSANLAYQHIRAASIADVRVHAVNLTRNIVIQSENTSDSDRFGHAMFMGNDVKLTGVAFVGMGRTAKREVVSDPTLPDSVYNDRYFNPRGRYAVHFHKGGTTAADPVAWVNRCVVRGSPGWAFVNHSASVEFAENVAMGFDGAGFVAEDGDEVGLYVGNVAVGGLGNGEFPNQRTVFGNAPRMDQGDMGFTGDGFWFQSPDVTVVDNIAAGCKGAGFFFWCGGRFDPSTNHYTGRPIGRALPNGVNPRRWDYNKDGSPDAVVITDMPLAGFSGNTAYGCFMGLKIRFLNHGGTAIFDSVRPDPPGNLDLVGEIYHANGYAGGDKKGADRARFSISDCTFWNNLVGIHASYLTNCDFSNIDIIAEYAPRAAKPTPAPPYSQDTGLGAIGLDFHTQNISNTLTNVTVQNYTTGAAFEDDPDNGANVDLSDVTFTGCVQNAFGGAGNSWGYSYFYLIFASDNQPDSPQ